MDTELVRSAFRNLRMPHQILKARAHDTRRLYSVVEAMREGELAGASFSGETSEGVLELVDVVDTSAEHAGNVDLLSMGQGGKLTAHNAMLLTFSELVQSLGQSCRSAAVIGDSAASRAVVGACRSLDIQVVVVTSPQWSSTEALCESDAARRMRDLGALATLWPRAPQSDSTRFSSEMRLQFADLAASADLLVHAPGGHVAAGAADEGEAIVPWERTHRDAVAIDLYYRSGGTSFVRGATTRGLRVVGGVEMLARLTSRKVETWTGLRPENEALLAAAHRVLAEQSP
ncbi:MAG: hypothetical protein MUF54_15735 [Polyangiaceae bacterium]|nr:hypothetical protein [Polyangiaceae bacterium]